MNSKNSKITLGTAQFGLSYGITNTRGKLASSEIASIIAKAAEVGIFSFDTAIMYGNAEEALSSGLSINNLLDKAKIVTKINRNTHSLSGVVKDIQQSFLNLKVSKIHGVLCHNADLLLGIEGRKIWDYLYELKTKDQVTKLGVSVYNPEELNNVLEQFPIDIVQIPYNVFDQSFDTSGLLSRLHTLGVEVHARSPFLQGVLLTPTLPPYFKKYKKVFDEFKELTTLLQLKPLEFCLSHSLSHPFINQVVVGVSSENEFIEITNVKKKPSINFQKIAKRLAQNDSQLTNPSLWKIQ